MDREQLQAEERQLAAKRRRQESYLGFVELATADSPRGRDLIDQEREKLRGIEGRLDEVREALRLASPPPAAAAPTLS